MLPAGSSATACARSEPVPAESAVSTRPALPNAVSACRWRGIAPPEVVAAGVAVAGAGDDHLAVRLQQHGLRNVAAEAGRNVGHGEAGAAKARVGLTVAVQPHHAKRGLLHRDAAAAASKQYLAIGLADNRLRLTQLAVEAQNQRETPPPKLAS